jgi:hypothetical protein
MGILWLVAETRKFGLFAEGFLNKTKLKNGELNSAVLWTPDILVRIQSGDPAIPLT